MVVNTQQIQTWIQSLSPFAGSAFSGPVCRRKRNNCATGEPDLDCNEAFVDKRLSDFLGKLKTSSSKLIIIELLLDFYSEAVAKLLCLEKSIILRAFTSGSNAGTVHSTRPTPCGLGEEKGCKWPQKSDFNGQMSFAIPSVTPKATKLFFNDRFFIKNYKINYLLPKFHAKLFLIPDI